MGSVAPRVPLNLLGCVCTASTAQGSVLQPGLKHEAIGQEGPHSNAYIYCEAWSIISKAPTRSSKKHSSEALRLCLSSEEFSMHLSTL